MHPGRKPQFGPVALTGAEKTRRWRDRRKTPEQAALAAERVARRAVLAAERARAQAALGEQERLAEQVAYWRQKRLDLVNELRRQRKQELDAHCAPFISFAHSLDALRVEIDKQNNITERRAAERQVEINRRQAEELYKDHIKNALEVIERKRQREEILNQRAQAAADERRQASLAAARAERQQRELNRQSVIQVIRAGGPRYAGPQ
jgi:hypothetical protein